MSTYYTRQPPPSVIGECIEWAKSRDNAGYGRRRFRGKTMGAHRAAWIEHRGSIPPGMTVDHMCFNILCVNVDHLRLLTNEENAGNQRAAFKSHCSRGHAMTEDNVYVRPGFETRRRCRACNRERDWVAIRARQAKSRMEKNSDAA